MRSDVPAWQSVDSVLHTGMPQALPQARCQKARRGFAAESGHHQPMMPALRGGPFLLREKQYATALVNVLSPLASGCLLQTGGRGSRGGAGGAGVAGPNIKATVPPGD